MKAYNPEWLQNRALRDQTARWKRQGVISEEKCRSLWDALPVGFRKTNPAADLGLFLFTMLAAGGSFLLLVELFAPEGSVAFRIFALVSGLGYAVLNQWLISRQRFCRNGVDSALLLVSAALIVTALSDFILPSGPPFWLRCVVALPLLGALVWYYGDTLLTFALLATCYALIGERLMASTTGQHPLVLASALATASAGLYALTRHRIFRRFDVATYYADALTLAQWFTLVALAASLNYYVVHEIDTLLHPGEPDDTTHPVALLLWATTFGVPLAYGYIGVRDRNRMFLLLAGLTSAGAVATARHYVGALPWAVHLSLSGALLLLAGAFLIRWLKQPRGGFTDQPDEDSPDALLDVATVAASQTIAPGKPDGPRFGGGNFDGGGAGKRY